MVQNVSVPPRVSLQGIGYKVVVADNMILFSSEPGVWGCYTRMMFQRLCGCWYVTIKSSNDMAMVSHIIAAQKLVEEWFGANFKQRHGENEL